MHKFWKSALLVVNAQLIHSANLQSRPVVIIVFAHMLSIRTCPSPLFKSSETKQQKTMIATGESGSGRVDH